MPNGLSAGLLPRQRAVAERLPRGRLSCLPLSSTLRGEPAGNISTNNILLRCRAHSAPPHRLLHSQPYSKKTPSWSQSAFAITSRLAATPSTCSQKPPPPKHPQPSADHVILCQALAAPSRHFCSCSLGPGRTMQPLPFDVLQRREQQGEGEAAARRCASRESAEGGREVDPREHTSRAAPLYLAAQDRAYATSPPPSPTPATWLDGPSAEEASRGRGLTRPKLAPATPPQGGVTTRKRPPLGPRTQTPPSWPPATETVPPQFLGGRVGPDARRLSWRGDKGLEMASSNEIDELRLTLSTRSPSPGQSDSQTPRYGALSPQDPAG